VINVTIQRFSVVLALFLRCQAGGGWWWLVVAGFGYCADEFTRALFWRQMS